MSLSLSVVSASIGNVQQLAVDARLLHQTLGAKRDFSNWIKGRIGKYSFKENEDFIIFAKSGEKAVRGRHSIEYTLSLDMAKELAMVENNERGRLVRRYFIECERRLQQNAQPRPQRKSLPKEKDYSTLKLLNALSQVEMLMDKTFRYYRSQMCPYVQEMTARAAFDDRGLQTHLIRQTYQDTYLAAQYLQLAVQHTNFAYDTARSLKRVLEVPGRIEFF